MNSRLTQIGFSQRVRLEWLERVANLVLAGNDEVSIDGALQELLVDKLSVGGDAKRGNREKVITILTKIWVRPPRDLEPLRRDGLVLLSGLPRRERIAVHWGMAHAVYPFWGTVAAQVGRLLRLQGRVAASQVQRRVREQYGERETVSRAARRVLRSFIDWEVLKETARKGVYTSGLTLQISHEKVIAWLVEAFLWSHTRGSATLGTVLRSPSLFPLQLGEIGPDRLASVSPRLEVIRLGGDEDLVTIRGPAQEAQGEGVP